MLPKTLFSFLILISLSQQVNAISVITPVALASGCAAGYFSKYIFCKIEETKEQGKPITYIVKDENDQNMILQAHAPTITKYRLSPRCFTKKIAQNVFNASPSSGSNETKLEKYILGFRITTGVLTFLLIKRICKF